jgi:hypothetical protein
VNQRDQKQQQTQGHDERQDSVRQTQETNKNLRVDKFIIVSNSQNKQWLLLATHLGFILRHLLIRKSDALVAMLPCYLANDSQWLAGRGDGRTPNASGLLCWLVSVFTSANITKDSPLSGMIGSFIGQ